MVSPLLDEQIMLQALEKAGGHEDLRENARRLSAGATMLVMDAFDRKVTRDVFLQCLSAALGLVDTLGHYDMMAGVQGTMTVHGAITATDIELTLQQLLSDAHARTDRAKILAESLTQCPMDEDKIN